MPWEDLTVAAERNAEWARQEATTDPVACPDDGQPLVTNVNGILFCPFCGWRPDWAPPT